MFKIFRVSLFFDVSQTFKLNLMSKTCVPNNPKFGLKWPESRNKNSFKKHETFFNLKKSQNLFEGKGFSKDKNESKRTKMHIKNVETRHFIKSRSLNWDKNFPKLELKRTYEIQRKSWRFPKPSFLGKARTIQRVKYDTKVWEN